MKSLLLMLSLAAAPSAPSAPAEVKPAPKKAEAPPVAKPVADKQEKKKPAAPAADKKGQDKKGQDEEGQDKEGATFESPPPRSFKPFSWTVPGLLQWVDSVGPQVSQGVPMELAMALSSEPVPSLIQHFADAFQESGLYIPPDSAQGSETAEPILTALDPDKMVSYTVVFQANPDRTTTLYLGTADMNGFQLGVGHTLDWAPLMPGAKKLMRTELEAGQNAVYQVSSTEAEVLAFYRQALGKQGYEEREPGVFVRGGEMLRVFTSREAEELSVGLIRQVRQAEEVAPAPAP